MEVTTKLTWERLVQLEPRLLDLYNRARKSKPTNKHCWIYVWFGDEEHAGLKRELLQLVGWDAPLSAAAELTTELAYDIAYHHILDAIPGCEGCRCYED